ncbi:MAG: diguanylate cyclase [Planctomycetaceae bacterium]
MLLIIADFFVQLVQTVNNVVGSGGVVAIAAICTLQYLVYVNRRTAMRRANEMLSQQLHGVEVELGSVQKDRSLARLENQILREFVSETEINRVLGLLLKRFVPNAESGFGSLVRLAGGQKLSDQCRGLSEESRANLKIDASFLRRVTNERAIMIEGSELAGSELSLSLTPKDRGKARRLFLVAVGDSENLAGVFVTTSLYPEEAPLEQQLELARRLMLSVAGDLRQSQALEQQEHRLRTTAEVLELRSIVDRHYDTPLAMVEAFLDRVRHKLGADRAAIYLLGADSSKSKKALVRSGNALQQNVLVQWSRYEDLLADSVITRPRDFSWDEKALARIGIDSLISTAFAAPLIRDDKPIGVVCFTRKTSAPLDPAHIELGTWSTGYLADTLLRVLNHAVAERQARQDPLTGLANRRAFDLEIERNLNAAREKQGECALLLCDIDHFKAINDRYGHPAGDEVLRATARILREQILEIRSEDRALAARYGGEEFAVLLPGIGSSGAERIAESIRSAIQSHKFRFQQAELQATISIGYATHPNHGASPVELIAAADAALYSAKHGGRNRVTTLVASTV